MLRGGRRPGAGFGGSTDFRAPVPVAPNPGLSCEGLRTPATTTFPRAPTAGVGKAPMDEIARGGRRRCGGRYEGLVWGPTLMRTGGTASAQGEEAFARRVA